MILRVEGEGAALAFCEEQGGHRWQRVPPTEKRGRVHTSTITVAVLPILKEGAATIDERDLKWSAFRGSGKGGQHRNKTDSAVRIVHVPTGLAVRCETERSQKHNLRTARESLQARLSDQSVERERSERNERRRHQLGSGMRGDKRRTVRIQADQVVDHVTGRTISARRYLRGELEGLNDRAGTGEER